MTVTPLPQQLSLLDPPQAESSAEKPADKPATKKKTVAATRQEFARFLQGKCMEVVMRVNWFTQSTGIDKGTLQTMLKDFESDSGSVTATKRLFSSRHPVVKKANDARAALTRFFHSKTISAAAFSATAMTENQAKQMLQADPATRYVWLEDLEEFDAQMGVLAKNVIEAVEEVNRELESIKDFDRGQLKKLYCEKDYPEQVSTQVRGPDYKPVQFPADFGKLAPKAFARAQERAYERLAASVDLTVQGLAQGFLELAGQIANQLGRRTRLKVPQQHSLAYLREAEVLEFRDHKVDHDVPEGKIEVNLRFKPTKDGKNVTQWFNFTTAQYAELQPYTTEEKKKLYDSSLRSLREQCETVRDLSKMLGDSGQPLADSATKFVDLLASIGTTDKQVLEELRSSEFTRKKTVEQLEEVSTVLATSMNYEAFVSNRRRSIAAVRPRADE